MPRYLVKTWKERCGGPTVAYLNDPEKLSRAPAELSLQGLVVLYQQVHANIPVGSWNVPASKAGKDVNQKG